MEIYNIICQYYNKDGGLILCIENDTQDSFYLVNMDSHINYPIMDIWALDTLINEISMGSNVFMKRSFYTDFVSYLDEYKEDFESLDISEFTII